jgi:hypothetical protein
MARVDAARDWPLLAAAAAAVLSLIMLFAPWVSGLISLNAFGNNMQTTGPALIIVMVLAVIVLVYLALAVDRLRYATFALIPAVCLLAIYIIKIGDVSDLISLTGPASGLSLGVGLWLGLIFALVTVALLALAVMMDRRSGGPDRARPPGAPEAPGTSSKSAGPEGGRTAQGPEGPQGPRAPGELPPEPPKATPPSDGV